MCGEKLCPLLISGFFMVLAAYVAARFALKSYFTQKEYELVKQRYLEQGVDKLASTLQKNLSNLRHNCARILFLLKQYRDDGDNFDVDELENGFLDFHAGALENIANQRIQILTESSIIGDAYQSADVFIKTSSDTITKDITKVMKLKSIDEDINKRNYVIKTIIAKLEGINKEQIKYDFLISQLVYLSRILEKEKLSLKKLSKFKNYLEVKSIIATLEEKFNEELEIIRDASQGQDK